MSDLGPTQTLVLRACPLCDMSLECSDTWPWHYPALPAPGACPMSTLLVDDQETTEVPPWHPYDGCYGCRRGDALGRKALEKEKWDGSTPTH